MAQKWEVFWILTKILSIHLYFLLEYESINGFVTFFKNHVFKKNLVLTLRSKNLLTSQDTRSFKLRYLTNELIFEVQLLHVVTYL